MEEHHRRPERDVYDLLQNGFFKTTRTREPMPQPRASAPPPLNVANYHLTDRTTSRYPYPHSRPPPSPSVEDEVVSLAKETFVLFTPIDDPPSRGLVDQHPVILEADITEAEATRLHEQDVARGGKDLNNLERRYIYVPTQKIQENAPPGDDVPKPRGPQLGSHGSLKESKENCSRYTATPKAQPTGYVNREYSQQPEISRRKSRQDLPNIDTKIPKNIPPTFRRSTSLYDSPRAYDEARSTPRTPSASLLTPDFIQSAKHQIKDFFEFSSSSRKSHESGSARAAKRNSSGSYGNSRPPSPISENQGNVFPSPVSRPRAGTRDRLLVPKTLAEVHNQTIERPSSRQSERSDGHRSSKSKPGRPYHSSREDSSQGSDTEKFYGLQPQGYKPSGYQPESDRRPRSGSRSSRSSFTTRPVPSPRTSFEEQNLLDGSLEGGGRKARDISRPVSPMSPSNATLRPNNYLFAGDTSSSRPRSRATSTRPSETLSRGSASLAMPLPIPTPQLNSHAPPSPLQSPKISDYNNRTPRPVDQSQRQWQPPPFQQPYQSLATKQSIYRHYSEKFDSGIVAPLPTCPRTTYTRGRHDWLTLPHCSSFNICPSCFSSAVAPTMFRSYFVASPPCSSDIAIACDFGSMPWYRIAWLLILRERQNDLRLFYGLAHVVSSAQPCIGSNEATRPWHSIIDPDTSSPINTFSACLSCVKSLEVLLPTLKGVFVRRSDVFGQRVCDLRFDSPRFIQYFNALETSAAAVISPGYKGSLVQGRPQVDTRPLAALIKRKTAVAQCPGIRTVMGGQWFVIPSIPEIAVCQECFDEVVWPLMGGREGGRRERGRDDVPGLFAKDMLRIPETSCWLVGHRRREVWRQAVERCDAGILLHEVRGKGWGSASANGHANGNRSVRGGWNASDTGKLRAGEFPREEDIEDQSGCRDGHYDREWERERERERERNQNRNRIRESGRW